METPSPAPAQGSSVYCPVQSPQCLPRGEGQAGIEEPVPWAQAALSAGVPWASPDPCGGYPGTVLDPDPRPRGLCLLKLHRLTCQRAGRVRSLRESIGIVRRHEQGPSRPPAAPPAFVLWALTPDAELWPGHLPPARECLRQEGEASRQRQRQPAPAAPTGQTEGRSWGQSCMSWGWGDSFRCLLTLPWTRAVLVTRTARCSPAPLPHPCVQRSLTEMTL